MDNLEEALDFIDAAVFSGDTFSDAAKRAELREYMARWERELQSWDAAEAEV